MPYPMRKRYDARRMRPFLPARPYLFMDAANSISCSPVETCRAEPVTSYVQPKPIGPRGTSTLTTSAACRQLIRRATLLLIVSVPSKQAGQRRLLRGAELQCRLNRRVQCCGAPPPVTTIRCKPAAKTETRGDEPHAVSYVVREVPAIEYCAAIDQQSTPNPAQGSGGSVALQKKGDTRRFRAIRASHRNGTAVFIRHVRLPSCTTFRGIAGRKNDRYTPRLQS